MKTKLIALLAFVAWSVMAAPTAVDFIVNSSQQ